jgi:hypothetical protein
MRASLPIADRLVALLDHLGIGRAHIASQIPGDMAELAVAHPERLGGIVCVTPIRLDPAPFTPVAERMLIVAGEYGPTFEVMDRAAARLPGARRLMLEGYEAQGWADTAAERTGDLLEAMLGFLGGRAADTPKATAPQGEVAGITYRIEGSGPALILMPFFLAASQWAPARPALARHFTTIAVGGQHIGGMAMLEDRAAAPSYRAMFRGLVDAMAPQPGEAILDIGCGAGSLDRQLARLVPNKITAIDPNTFLQHVLSLLSSDELPVWHAARDKAAAEGTLLCSHALHCCIGTKAG